MKMSFWSRWWWWVMAVGQSVVGVTIVVLLLPLVVPCLVLLWAWRCLALLLVMAIHRRVVQVASGMEALFALDSEGARAVISGVTVLRGRVSVATVRKHLAERVTDVRDDRGHFKHPKFRQLLEKRCGVVVWMWEDNFHVDSHVRELRVNCRPRTFQDEKDIQSEMSARTNLPFVRGQSRWEVLVAPLRRFGTAESSRGEWTHTVVIVRLHHGLGDGRSMVGLIVSALVDPPLGDPRPSPVVRSHSPGCFAKTARLLWSLTHLPWVVTRVLIRGDSSVLHGSRLGGEKFLAWSPPLSLAALKNGRALAGVSVNDLLLAGLAAALYRHFKDEGVDKVPSQVMSVIPVDVTAPGTPISLANRISLCTVPLPTYRMSRTSRLMTVHRRLNTLKASPDVMVNYLALDLVSNLLPAPLARRALCTHGVTMVASNMPGPQEQIHLFGEPVEDIMFWIPNKSRTGLGLSMLSYCGVVRLGLNVDSALMPTMDLAQQLLERTTSEVNSILAELMPAKETKREEVHCPLHCELQHIDDDSCSSELSQVITHSTDEYEDGPSITVRASEYDLPNSSDTRMIFNSFSSLGSSSNYSSENQYLLGREFRRSKSQSLIQTDTDVPDSYLGNFQHRFVQSDINLKTENNDQVEDR